MASPLKITVTLYPYVVQTKEGEFPHGAEVYALDLDGALAQAEQLCYLARITGRNATIQTVTPKLPMISKEQRALIKKTKDWCLYCDHHREGHEEHGCVEKACTCTTFLSLKDALEQAWRSGFVSYELYMIQSVEKNKLAKKPTNPFST